ncbi:hypothetical protein CDG76_06165 [Nostoc sp. 'Peltigera membranacea cyanobiont' 210A]|uniref:hypothetical protein n=1 Tax=Nostoc sp. 'Peltigera membranacea cyanobiont' 210A TaxID=2014529 RepID=UPI000B951054|nr:hypothetical protein [Nostoc sp. 'Peltigera membranacea cyanobiont' 210A]OYD96384.1 hypothetical protein CDG76_06165 [Nostoc sp. 'Peltigera membranacea cyanobiont' 210A]
MRNDLLINTESPCFVPDETAIKTANYTQRHRSSSAKGSDRSVSNISDAERIAQTQKLLDRAIAYAWHTVKSDRKPPKLTRIRWVWQLAALYHLTHSTVPLMEEAAQRFSTAGHRCLAQWAAQKAREERGHDQLALLDIQAMGYEAEAVVEALVPPVAKTLLDYFTRSVQTSYPISCVGYSYTMERLAMGIDENYIQAVEALLPSNIQATRCLRVHSSVGSDVEHVDKTIEMLAGLTEERACVAIACYDTALLYFRSPNEGYMSEEELQNVLKPLKSHTHACG